MSKVLGWRRPGRIDRCRHYFIKNLEENKPDAKVINLKRFKYIIDSSNSDIQIKLVYNKYCSLVQLVSFFATAAGGGKRKQKKGAAVEILCRLEARKISGTARVDCRKDG